MANIYDPLEKVIIKCTSCLGKLRVPIDQLGTLKCPHCNSEFSADTRGCGDWGYKFTYNASNNFIQDIEPALEENLEFQNPQKIAEQLMLDLFGQTPYLFYVRRVEQGHNLGEQKWELILATDFDDLESPTQLEERGSTLKLVAIVDNDGYGGLRIIYARLRPKREGTKDSFAKSFYMRLRSNYQHRIGVPLQAIERMTDVPFKQDCIPTEQQLEAWKAFAEVEERIAREKQFCVPFVSHNYGEATTNITFAIDTQLATLDGKAENALTSDNFWQRAKKAKNNSISLLNNVTSDRSDRKIGTVTKVDIDNSLIKIELDSEILDLLAKEHYSIPLEGTLSFEAFGDLTQIKRKKQALKNLERGRTQNPYLGQFLFDASQAREPREAVQIQPQDLLLDTINPSQKAAVETVLSAPDLALIQGPPGTGKTTVIVEICYQVALRGGRTLIASQANLAVDNALSRLQHNPVIRAVRKGNTNRAGIEGEPFLEENVIKNWLQNTSTDCEQRLNAKLELAKILRQLLASSEQFATYLITERKFEPKQKQLIAHQIILETNYQNKLNTHKLAQDKQQKIESLLTNLKIFLNSQSTVNWDEPWLENLNPYLNRNASAQELAENVRLAITIVTELGVSHPDLHFLGIAEWLKDHIPQNLAKIQQALKYIEEAAKEIATLNSKQQLFKQNESSLERLKKTERQNFDSIQNQQQEIARIQSRQSEISLAQIELEQWLSNAPTQIKTTLKNCLQERRTFSEDLINFPNQLQNLISTVHNLSLQQYLQESLTEFNGLIEKYRQWDKAYVMANELDSILTDIFNKTTIEPPDEDAIVRATKQLTVNQLDFVSALHQLKQITQFRIAEINKPLSFWKRVVEGILAVASKLGWCQPSRRKRAIATLEAVRRQAHLIVRGSEPNNSNIVIESVTPNIVNSTVASTHNWLNELDTQTKQQLQLLEKHLNELEGWLEEVQQQISKAQKQLKAVGQDVNLGINSVNEILQKLTQIEQIPTSIKDLAHEYLQNPTRINVRASELSAQVNYYQNSIDKLETLITSFATLEILLSTKSKINDELEKQNSITIKSHKELRQSEQELNQIKTQIQQHLDNRKQQRYWWQNYWQTIPEHLKPELEFTDLFELNFLRRFKLQFEVWQQQLEVIEAYLNRYQNLIFDWIEGLKNPSEQNRHGNRSKM